MQAIFRRMREDDLDEIYEIEVASFSDPWPRDFFKAELEYDSYVYESDGRIAGFICTMQVLDECTVTNVCVRPDYRRQGIAESMMNRLFDIMDADGVRYYYLEVRKSNLPAQHLYEKLGFNRIGLRKEYYRNPMEDAVVMTLRRNLGQV